MSGSTGGTVTGELDTRLVGLVFIDLLFAAVATKILELSVNAGLPFEGACQLGLAAVLTITSWVSYHNSKNRSPYRLTFFNLDRKSTRLNSSHVRISYAVFCL